MRIGWTFISCNVVTVLLAAVLLACTSETSEPSTPVVETVATQTPAPSPTAVAEATEKPTEFPTPEPTTAPQSPESQLAVHFETVEGIVDPSNFGWPREVEGLNGIVSIPDKPLRIINASIGHDEMTLALVPVDRLVGVGSYSKDAVYSNIAALVQDVAEVTRDPETIIAVSPDVIVTSPYFPVEGVEALSKAGIPVVQTELENDPEARINAILLMGYIYGEEQRAIGFASEVRDRHESLVSLTKGSEPMPRVLALTEYSDMLWVAGEGSTEGGVIEAAGGANAAQEAGIKGNQTTSLEGVIAMNPDVIVIAQPVDFGANEFMERLLANEALAEIPAIKDNRVYVVESKHFTTLSHWNILGAEALARLLWPSDFPDAASVPFSTTGDQ